MDLAMEASCENTNKLTMISKIFVMIVSSNVKQKNSYKKLHASLFIQLKNLQLQCILEVQVSKPLNQKRRMEVFMDIFGTIQTDIFSRTN